MDLKDTFGKFVGLTLQDPYRWTPDVYPVQAQGRRLIRTGGRDVDTVLAQIEAEAQANGLSLRVLWPGTMGTMDIQPRRLNVHMDINRKITGFKLG